MNSWLVCDWFESARSLTICRLYIVCRRAAWAETSSGELRSGRVLDTPAVSLAEIKTAVETLSADELTELAAFIRERDNAAWDRQIDGDFADDGRLHSVAEEVRADIRAGRLQGLP